jgi:hypothetical protein
MPAYAGDWLPLFALGRQHRRPVGYFELPTAFKSVTVSWRPSKGDRQHPQAVQFLDPLAIQNVALPPRHALELPRLDQRGLYTVGSSNSNTGIQYTPVLSSATVSMRHGWRIQYGLFSRSGFTPALQRAARQGSVRLSSLAEIEKRLISAVRSGLWRSDDIEI